MAATHPRPNRSSSIAVDVRDRESGRTAAAGAHQAERAPIPAILVTAAATLLGVGLRLLYFAQPWRIDQTEFARFLSDEGVLGLMARHILHGARPIFYYGQLYLGAAEAYVTAVIFRICGESFATLRATSVLFALTWIPLTYAIGRRVFGRRAGLLAAALAAVPSPFVFEWGSKALTSFAQHVALVLAMFCLVLALMERVSAWRVAVLGFLAGWSIWSNQLVLAYLPLIGLATWRWVAWRRRDVALLMVAAAIGMAPLLYDNIVHPLETVRALLAHARSSGRLSAEAAESSDREYMALPLFEVLGVQHGPEGTWLPVGAVGAGVLVLGLVASVARANRLRHNDRHAWRQQLLLLGLIVVSLGVGVSGFSGQPVGRYQLILYPLLALTAAAWLDERVPRAAVAVVAVVVLIQAVQIAAPVTADWRSERDTVISTLEENGLRNGYAAGSMYDFVFAAHERVIIVPLDRSRYLPYEAMVAKAARVFYLYRDDQVTKESHQALMNHLTRNGVRYSQIDRGVYHILYAFDPPDSLAPDAVANVRNEYRSLKGLPPF